MSNIVATAYLDGFIRTPGRGDPPDNTDAIEFNVRILATCGGILAQDFTVEIPNTFTTEDELRTALKTAIADVASCQCEDTFVAGDVLFL